jgi:hypothetical protein
MLLQLDMVIDVKARRVLHEAGRVVAALIQYNWMNWSAGKLLPDQLGSAALVDEIAMDVRPAIDAQSMVPRVPELTLMERSADIPETSGMVADWTERDVMLADADAAMVMLEDHSSIEYPAPVGSTMLAVGE